MQEKIQREDPQDSRGSPPRFFLHHTEPFPHPTRVTTQTVTRTIESDVDPGILYRVLINASLLPRWAPLFADKVEPAHPSSFHVTKGADTFDIALLANNSALTVDYLRDMPNGERGGAFLRVMPRPLGGSVVTMTVPVAPNTTPSQVAEVLEQELETLINLPESKPALLNQ